MKAFEIVLIVACVLIVLSVVITSLIKKKKGKTSCGCDCSSCGYCSSCSAKKYANKNNSNT